MKQTIWFDVIPVYIDGGRVIVQQMSFVDPTCPDVTLGFTPELESWFEDMIRIDMIAFEEMLGILDKKSDDYRIAKVVYEKFKGKV